MIDRERPEVQSHWDMQGQERSSRSDCTGASSPVKLCRGYGEAISPVLRARSSPEMTCRGEIQS